MCAALLIAGLCGCEKIGNENNTSLRLGIPEDPTNHIGDYTIHTDALSVSFDILSGAGGYNATVNAWEFLPERGLSLPCGIAGIEGKTVTVELLESTAEVIVSDASGAEMYVYNHSDNSALQYFTWDKSIPYGSRSKNMIDFGAGAPYKIVEYSDRNAQDAFLDGSVLQTGVLVPGKHWFMIQDCRGTCRKFDVNVRKGYDIEGESLTVQAKAGERLSFPFLFGKRWKVVEGETGPESFVFKGSDDIDGFPNDTFIVKTDNETASWTFEDRTGLRAVLTIEIVK